MKSLSMILTLSRSCPCKKEKGLCGMCRSLWFLIHFDKKKKKFCIIPYIYFQFFHISELVIAKVISLSNNILLAVDVLRIILDDLIICLQGKFLIYF